MRRSPALIFRPEAQKHLPRMLIIDRERGIVLGGYMDITEVTLQRVARVDRVSAGRMKDKINDPDGLVDRVRDR